MIITMSVDVLAPHGARPSAGTVMTVQLHILSTKFTWLEVMSSYHFWPDDIIQNGRQDLEKFLGTPSVNTEIDIASATVDRSCYQFRFAGIFITYTFIHFHYDAAN